MGTRPARGFFRRAGSLRLRYVTEGIGGIERRRAGRGFIYLGPRRRPVREPAALARIKALVIPPAWTHVWICPDPRGHLQATGIDAKGRKQYRYHAEWRSIRDETKYGRLLAFGRALPRIRRRIRRDLRLPGLPRDKVLAVVVRLLDETLIRVGSEAHADRYSHYGLTTLQDRHVRVTGDHIEFRFVGKSGKEHEIGIRDPQLADLVKRSQDLPGQDLFQYVDHAGKRRDIESGHVNDYIRTAAGEEFTAKDFRTWTGTVLAARELYAMRPARSQTAAKRSIARAVRAVATELGNTPAVCRSSYIHPGILRAYTDQSLWTFFGAPLKDGAPAPRLGLRRAETQMLRFLRAHGRRRTR